MNMTIGTTFEYEPIYKEKIQILQRFIKRKNTVAMEVFSRQSNVVDQADMYHIWIAQKSKFPFGILETTEIPETKNGRVRR